MAATSPDSNPSPARKGASYFYLQQVQKPHFPHEFHLQFDVLTLCLPTAPFWIHFITAWMGLRKQNTPNGSEPPERGE